MPDAVWQAGGEPARAVEEPARTVDVHYRRLDRVHADFPAEITLAEALRRSLQRKIDGHRVRDDVRTRVQDSIPNRPGDIRCWNNILAGRGAVFGTLCLYRPSELQAVIQARNIRGQVTAYPLDQVGEAGGRDFLRAIAYWMAIEDHFYLIQTPSIQTTAMEDYLGWLLRKVGILTDGQGIQLQVALDRDVVGGDLDDLLSVNIGGTFEPPSVRERAAVNNDVPPRFVPGAVDLQTEPVERVERRRVGRKPFITEGWKLLHQVIQDERSLEEIEDAYRELRAEDPNATLDAELEFFVRTRRRTDTGRAAKQRTLQAISSGLRDLPDGAVTARGKDGMVKGNEIRLKAPRRIRLAPPPAGAAEGAQSALLDLEHAFQEMQVVHRRFLEDGKIE